MNNNLYIDMIPKSSWYNNLRSVLTEKEWKNLKQKVYQKYNYRCSICNGIGPKWPVEAHERWEYKNNKQILVDIVALCPDCHLSTHMGLAQVLGKQKKALEHLKKINNFNDKELETEYIRAFRKYEERNKIKWKLDLSFLINNFDLNDKTKNKINKYK